MKRTPLILLSAAAAAAFAIGGTALAAGGHDTAVLQGGSSPAATVTATAPSPSTTTASPTSAPVSRERAAGIALVHTGGGELIEAEPEMEHGRPAWSVKIVLSGVRHEVYIDRNTGQIIKAEQQPAGDDRGTDDRGTDDKGGDHHGGQRH
jgi:hypothetical protein